MGRAGRMPNRISRTLGLIVWVVLFGVLGTGVGCQREDLRIYEVPKDRSLSLKPSQSAGERDSDTPRLTWSLPAGWEETVPGPIQYAAFRIPGSTNGEVRVTITRLYGTGGPDLANVNRWRAQIGLEAVKPDVLPRLRQSIQIDGKKAVLYDVVGPTVPTNPPERKILVAIVRRPTDAWFFKMTGPAQSVESLRGQFLQFLQSIHFSSRTRQTPATPKEDHPNS